MRIELVLICISWCLFTSGSLDAQLTGNVTDNEGMPLAYANVYVLNSSHGTATNEEGEYTLELEDGSQTIVYQYIGYKSVSKSIDFQKTVELNVQLEPLDYNLSEIVIYADAEDPAYNIIRQAIKNRKGYLDKHQQFECEAYSKGISKLKNAPKRIFGEEIGDLDGSLDSTRSGIVYFSESVSTLFYEAPSTFFEKVHASKVSGDATAYTFNSASDMYLNFYENHIEFNRQLISPISDAALQYYGYRLEETYYDENGTEVYVISVIPKLETTPCYSGTIHIADGEFNLKYIDLKANKKATKIWVMDSIRVNQTFTKDQDHLWNLSQCHIQMYFNFLGSDFIGDFFSSYYDYKNENVAEQIQESSHLAQVVEEDSNLKTTTYWDSIRPIPLTVEERVDYVEKDSIYKVRHSDTYLDSIDRNSRKWTVGKLFSSYKPQNSKKYTTYKMKGLLNALSFNTVQGIVAGVEMDRTQHRSQHEVYENKTNLFARYGFSSKNFDVGGGWSFERFDKHLDKFIIRGGIKYVQYNRLHGMSPLQNTIWTLFLERNYAKYYRLSDFRIAYQKQFLNGLIGYVSGAYEYKRSDINHVSRGIVNFKNVEFTSNNPLDPDNNTYLFDSNKGLFFSAVLRYQFGQKYYAHGKKYYRLYNDSPILTLAFRKEIGISENGPSLNQIQFKIKDGIAHGAIGTSQYALIGGTFFDFTQGSFAEYKHFRTSEVILVGSDIENFLALPYYRGSTDSSYGEVHLRHKFQGFIMDRIPLLRKTGVSLLVQYNSLFRKGNSPYHEWGIGLDNIGIGKLKLMRAWFVKPYGELADSNWYIRLGFPLLSNN